MFVVLFLFLFKLEIFFLKIILLKLGWVLVFVFFEVVLLFELEILVLGFFGLIVLFKLEILGKGISIGMSIELFENENIVFELELFFIDIGFLGFDNLKI